MSEARENGIDRERGSDARAAQLARLFRAEAMHHHANSIDELRRLPPDLPGWTRFGLRALIALAIVLAAAAGFVPLPQYDRGSALVQVRTGAEPQVIAVLPANGGRVEAGGTALLTLNHYPDRPVHVRIEGVLGPRQLQALKERHAAMDMPPGAAIGIQGRIDRSDLSGHPVPALQDGLTGTVAIPLPAIRLWNVVWPRR